MQYIILDIDNCIADDEWRIHTINWQHTDRMLKFHDYHSLSAFDRSDNHHLWRNNNHGVIILTARPVRYRAVTMEWLRRNGVRHEFVLMRNDYERCDSVQLKRKQVAWLISCYDIQLKDVVAAYDDRQDVVDMYSFNYGIKAEVCKIHNTPYGPTKKEPVQ